MKLDGEDMTLPTTDGQTEISVKGDWVKVQALYVNGTTIIVRGRWLKTAFVTMRHGWKRESKILNSALGG